MMMTENTLKAANRRVIGPIPPRDKRGRLAIGPVLQKQPKRNILGEPERDDKDRPIEIEVDVRPPQEYHVFDGTQQAEEGATRGLRLFEVDYSAEPILKVWARNEHEAIEVYKREWGIIRLGDTDPKVTEVKRGQ